MAFLSAAAIDDLGLKSVGSNVSISARASLYRPENIAIGDNVRIDDFCVLSAGNGGIMVGNNVHVAVYSSIIGAGSVSIGDFANISSRVSIYSSNDDYSGMSMTNPTVPDEYKNVNVASVNVGRHVIIGSGTVILPGVSIGEGCAVGALSLVNKDLEAWSIYIGVPARLFKKRDKGLLRHEARYLRGE